MANEYLRRMLPEGSAKKLYACLPGTAREAYVELSLSELSAVMRHALSEDRRPWHFLDHVSKQRWILSSLSDLMDVAPPSWRPAVLRCGWSEHNQPGRVVHCRFQDLEQELQEALRSVCRALAELPWVQITVSAHGQCLAHAASETAPVKRAVDSSVDNQQPHKSVREV